MFEGIEGVEGIENYSTAKRKPDNSIETKSCLSGAEGGVLFVRSFLVTFCDDKK